MFKKLILAAGLLAIAELASAGPLVLSVSGGGWTSPVGPAGICADIDNAPGQLQDQVRWNGEDLLPFAATDQYTVGGDACGLVDVDPSSGLSSSYLTSVSGYNFDPVDGILGFQPGTGGVFSLGTFQHLNDPISDAITAVDYQMSIVSNDFAPGGAPNPLGLSLTFLHDETNNEPTDADPNCCADVVTVMLPSMSTTFQVGTDFYSFSLLGFSPTAGNGSFTTQFSSPEGGTNSTQLWAQINPVPEPATLMLFGTGLLGLGAMARRRIRRKV